MTPPEPAPLPRALNQHGNVGEAAHRAWTIDPRVQLGWLAAVVGGTVLGGDAGLMAGAAVAIGGVLLARAARSWLRLVAALAPLALALIAFATVGGDAAGGIRAALRLAALASLSLAFSRTADGGHLAAGLQALRLPDPVVFALTGGAAHVPDAWDDIGAMRDAARLRGVGLDGPPWRQLAAWRRVLVPLVVNTVRRGLQLGEAMEARGYGASPRRSSRHPLRWRWRDSLGLLGAAAYLGAVLAAGTLVSVGPGR